MTDGLPKCPNGCGLLHPHYDNVGFHPSEGAPHIEIEKWYCPTCGYENSDPRELADLEDAELETEGDHEPIE